VSSDWIDRIFQLMLILAAVVLIFAAVKAVSFGCFQLAQSRVAKGADPAGKSGSTAGTSNDAAPEGSAGTRRLALGAAVVVVTVLVCGPTLATWLDAIIHRIGTLPIAAVSVAGVAAAAYDELRGSLGAVADVSDIPGGRLVRALPWVAGLSLMVALAVVLFDAGRAAPGVDRVPWPDTASESVERHDSPTPRPTRGGEPSDNVAPEPTRDAQLPTPAWRTLELDGGVRIALSDPCVRPEGARLDLRVGLQVALRGGQGALEIETEGDPIALSDDYVAPCGFPDAMSRIKHDWDDRRSKRSRPLPLSGRIEDAMGLQAGNPVAPITTGYLTHRDGRPLPDGHAVPVVVVWRSGEAFVVAGAELEACRGCRR
jgi:hypothetical protein